MAEAAAKVDHLARQFDCGEEGRRGKGGNTALEIVFGGSWVDLKDNAKLGPYEGSACNAMTSLAAV